MRWPRLRVTVRWLLMLVAISALVMGGIVLRRRSIAYRELARRHALAQLRFLDLIEEFDRPTRQVTMEGVVTWKERREEWAARLKRASFLKAERHAAMRRAYEYATDHPWIGVRPDPEARVDWIRAVDPGPAPRSIQAFQARIANDLEESMSARDEVLRAVRAEGRSP